MFRIRRILDAAAPANKSVIVQVQEILRAQFSGLKEEEILALPEKLNNPLKYRFQSRLLVAEKASRRVLGFAFMLHVSDIGFCLLEYIASGTDKAGQGIGGALYERVQTEAQSLNARALFFECLPDDPSLSPDPAIRKQNAKRLAFYEKFKAFPIEGTKYETPVKDGDTDPPYLVIDTLDQPLPEAQILRKIVRTILKRKYGDACPTSYIDEVVKSFTDNKIKLRLPKYVEKVADQITTAAIIREIPVFCNEGHVIHHVEDQGYVESPVRIEVILKELKKTTFYSDKTQNIVP